MKNRKRMRIIGVTFLATSAIVYFLIMVSWLQVAVTLSSVNWMRSIIGLVAITFGIYNLNKYIKTRNQEVGCEVTNDKQRSKLMERMKNIVKKQNLFLALLGVVGLAVTVNVIELACSAGLPAIYTHILSGHELPTWNYYIYLTFYTLIFLIDDLIVFFIAMISLKMVGVEGKYEKYSKLFGEL